jgi:hypothetical protein
MGSMLMTRGEADVPTSPRAPPAPASSARGVVAVLESVAGGGVAPLSLANGGRVAVLASSTNDYATTLGSGNLVR